MLSTYPSAASALVVSRYSFLAPALSSRPLLLVVAIVIGMLTFHISGTDAAPLRVGFVHRIDSTSASSLLLHERIVAAELRAQEQEVLDGLRFWADEWTRNRVRVAAFDSVQLIVGNTSSEAGFGDAYLSLLASSSSRIDALIGPIGDAATRTTLQALITAFALNRTNDANSTAYTLDSAPYFASLSAANSTLELLYPRVSSVLPTYRRPYDHHLPALRDFVRRGAKTYVVLTHAPNADDERDSFMFRMANDIVDDLTDPEDVYYTLQHFGVFNGSAELGKQLAHVVRIRPRPDVIVLAMPLRLRSSDGRADVYEHLSQFRVHKVRAKGILLLDNVDLLDRIEDPHKLKKTFRGMTTQALWAPDLEWTGRKEHMGATVSYAKRMKKFAQQHTSQYHALGSASGLLLQLWVEHEANGLTPAPIVLKKSFFGAITVSTEFRTAVRTTRYADSNTTVEEFISAVDRSNTALEPLHTQMARQLSQRSVASKHARLSHVLYPARWVWITYALSSGAVAGIVLATLLAVVALFIAVYGLFKFVYLFLNPPQDENAENTDEGSGDEDEMRPLKS